jgi:hypothetical protein
VLATLVVYLQQIYICQRIDTVRRILLLCLLCRIGLPVAVLSTVLRYFLNWSICGGSLGKETSAKNKRNVLLEESWLLAASLSLLALSTWVSELHNDNCSLLNQDSCFVGWPSQSNSYPATMALAVFFGWYVHGVCKSLVPGIGLHAGMHALLTRSFGLNAIYSHSNWMHCIYYLIFHASPLKSIPLQSSLWVS